MTHTSDAVMVCYPSAHASGVQSVCVNHLHAAAAVVVWLGCYRGVLSPLCRL
jgi:hypothetical protein